MERLNPDDMAEFFNSTHLKLHLCKKVKSLLGESQLFWVKREGGSITWIQKIHNLHIEYKQWTMYLLLKKFQ